MSQNITYKVTSLTCLKEKDSKTNVVSRIDFKFIVEDTIYNLTASTPSYVELVIVVEPGTFIEYENLTEEQVISWIENNITEDHKNSLISLCNTKIKLQDTYNRPLLPWENN